MTAAGDFRNAYADALREHLAVRTETTLAVGHDLGRRALAEQISILDIIETHARIVGAELVEPDRDRSTVPAGGALTDRSDPSTQTRERRERASGALTERSDPSAQTRERRERASGALEFLLQTLATLDIATRGFLDGTRRYEQQRARADEYAERDAFRTALVESLQEGFFVAETDGTVVEINSAFGDMTGFGPDGVPYAWPHPWITAERDAELPAYFRDGGGQFEIPIRHRAGRPVWLAVSSNFVPGDPATPEGTHAPAVFVGTIRDITAQRAAAAAEQALAQLAAAVGGASSVADVLGVGLEHVRAAVDAVRAIAAVWPVDGGEPVVYVSGDPVRPTWRDLNRATRQLLEVARSERPLTVTAVAASRTAGVPNGMSASLGSTGEGALWLEHSTPRPASADDRAVVAQLIGQLSIALQRARSYDHVRETSITLQRAMLGPVELPPRFAVRYEPAVPPLEIGGDWYDVVQLSDGCIAVVVGDCVGRGLAAAAVMGQLRSSARALLLSGLAPGQLLDELDNVAERIPGALCTTVCAAIIDPAAATMRYSSAGHMPGLLAVPGSGGVRLDDAKGPPLAVTNAAPRREATVSLPAGASLIIYTDGLVERRGVDIDLGIDSVADLLSQAITHTPDGFADLVLDTLRSDQGYDDDVAMIVYRQPPTDLVLETRAEPAQLAYIRQELASWLDAGAVPTALAADTVLAVNEACTNSVEHAYRNRTAEHVAVTAHAEPNELVITIRDTGRWKEPDQGPHYRGNGLALIRALSDGLAIDHSDAGTIVRITTAMPLNRRTSGIDSGNTG